MRPGPRVVGWPIIAAVWGAGFAVWIVCLSQLDQGSTSPAGAVLFLSIELVSGVSMAYAAMRLRSGGSIWSNALKARGYPVGDPDSSRRPADPEEREAWKRFRRGEIDRIAYERIMAHRRFVHGELALDEYHEVMSELEGPRPASPPRTGGGAVASRDGYPADPIARQ